MMMWRKPNLPKGKVHPKKKASDDDDDDDDDVEVEDDWEKPEEEDDWDPDFDEVLMFLNQSLKKAVGGKKGQGR